MEEFTWLISHPEIEKQYAGEYVAILNESVVAHGKDFKAVLEEAEQHGKDPLIHKVPAANTDWIV